MSDDDESKGDNVRPLYPPPPEPPQLKPAQHEAMKLLLEAEATLSRLGAWIRSHWSE